MVEKVKALIEKLEKESTKAILTGDTDKYMDLKMAEVALKEHLSDYETKGINLDNIEVQKILSVYKGRFNES